MPNILSEMPDQHEKLEYIAEFKKGKGKRKFLGARKEETQWRKVLADTKTV